MHSVVIGLARMVVTGLVLSVTVKTPVVRASLAQPSEAIKVTVTALVQPVVGAEMEAAPLSLQVTCVAHSSVAEAPPRLDLHAWY